MDAGDGLCSREAEVFALKEAIRSQQQLLQKLYVELDEEREASATAASEALSMILRLQGEKAAVKMEADHYRRVAEERVCHAESSLVVFEDVVRQKDMEIASLEFQVLAYRYKLMSLGCGGDLGVGENRVLESLFCQRLDLYGWGGVESGGGNVRRINSLPPPCSEDICRNKYDSIPENRFGCAFQEQMKVLDGRKDSWCQPIISSTRSRSSTERLSGPAYSAYDEAVTVKVAPQKADCAVSVHDVFEVPGLNRSCKGIRADGKEGCTGPWNDMDDNRLGKPDSDPEAPADWIKDMLVSLHNDKVHAKSREINTCAIGDDPEVSFQEIEDAEIGDDVQELSIRVERLEKKRSSRSEGIIREQLKTLKEIKEQLSMVMGEMRRKRSKNDERQPHGQVSLLSLQEAMLHFWL